MRTMDRVKAKLADDEIVYELNVVARDKWNSHITLHVSQNPMDTSVPDIVLAFCGSFASKAVGFDVEVWKHEKFMSTMIAKDGYKNRIRATIPHG